MITAMLSPASVSQGGQGVYVLAPHARLLLVQDDTARLLDLDGAFCALSPTGTALLCASLQHDLDTAVQSVATAYRVDAQQVRHDLSLFLADLAYKRLIYPTASPPLPGAKRDARWSSRLLRTLLRHVKASTALGPTRVGLVLALAYVSIRLLGLAHTITVWQQAFPPPRRSAARLHSVARDIDETVRTMVARHPLPLTCKERALGCWALLRAAGFPAELVIGIELFPLASHCWCEMEADVLTDDADRCRRFTPVWRYA